MHQHDTGITSFALKIAAIVGMACNHVANAFLPALPPALAFALYSVGGLTFPIMGFLITEGFVHTSNFRSYLFRLLAFAAVSQVPYSLLWGAEGNVLFTLAAGLVILKLRKAAREREIPLVACFAGGLLLVAATALCDWGIIGPVMILVFHELRGSGPAGVGLTMLIPLASVGLPAVAELCALAITGAWGAIDSMTVFQLGYCFIGFTAATLLLSRYNGKRGAPLKWLFYLFYPGHLLIIWLAEILFKIMLDLPLI